VIRPINRLERWLLRRIFRQIVQQGAYHADNIAEVYHLLHQACRREFCEDNAPTLDSFLLEQFQRSARHAVSEPESL